MAKIFTLLSALLVVIAITVPSIRSDGEEAPSLSTAGPSTESPPTAGPSTESPPTAGPSTAGPPTASPSTASPSTASPSTESPSTAGPSTAGPSTTASVGTGPSTTSIPSTTKAPNPCDSNPCGDGSTCEDRFSQSFVCLCLPGDSYDVQTLSCQRAQVFPGQLKLSKEYSDKMSDKKSQEFKDTSMEITSSIDNLFKETAYSQSTVLELRKSNTRTDNKVEASVEIIFKANAGVNKEMVEKKMKEASKEEGLLQGSAFDAKGLCDFKPCNEHTTTCESKDGSFSCKCTDGYIPTPFSNRICLECPSGTKAKGLECVNCPFGQTGFKCEDNRLLVVVIVASVIGGLLLITLILLPIMVVKTKKKTSKGKNEDYGKPYISHSVAKAPPPANSNTQNGHSTSFHGSTNEGPSNVGVPRIPRAMTTSNWDSRTNLEMTPSNSRQNLIPSGRNTRMYDDEDDKFTFDQSRPQSNPYSQNPPQRNPYAQNRAVNPYAQSQGNSNPYYM